METEQLEKQLQIWNHFMYMTLGASITFLIISFGCFIHPDGWPSFANYVAGPWMVLQLLVTSSGFYLLWGNRWRALPFRKKKNTIIGFFIASWLTFLAFGLMTINYYIVDLGFLFTVGVALFTLGYAWLLKGKQNPVDEIFP